MSTKTAVHAAAKAPRKASTNRLPRFVPLDWEAYSVGPEYMASKEQLMKAVSRAGKAANQRLRQLEKLEKPGFAYKAAMKNLPEGRRRFKERTAKMTEGELRREYARLREFLSAKSSTPTGQKEIDEKRYAKALEKGFQGSIDDWQAVVEKYFAELGETLYSSNVVYQAIVEQNTDILDRIIADSMAKEKSLDTEATQLISYLRRVKRKKSRLEKLQEGSNLT